MDFSFNLTNGDKAVIIGEEGNGKSTLLKLIYDRKLVESYCEWDGKIISKSKLAYLPQMIDESISDMTLSEYFENTEYYLYTDILTKLGITLDFILSDQKLGTLSGGEKVKVQLAKLYMEDPDILLLDEPTNDLDISTLQWLEQFISDSRLPILYISHDETLIENTANVIIHIEQLSHKTKSKITVVRCDYQEYLKYRRQNFEHQGQVAQKQGDEYDKQMDKWRQIYNRVDYEQKTITRKDPGGARLLKKKMHAVQSMGRRFARQKENFLDFPEQEEAIITKFDESISIPLGKTVLDLSLDFLTLQDKCLLLFYTFCGGACGNRQDSARIM